MNKYGDLDIEQGFVLGQADALKYLKWAGEQYLDEAIHDYQDTDIIAEQIKDILEMMADINKHDYEWIKFVECPMSASNINTIPMVEKGE